MALNVTKASNIAQSILNLEKSPLAGCAACTSAALAGYGSPSDCIACSQLSGLGQEAATHAADPPGFFESIPWKWVGGTALVAIPITAFLTYKVTQSMAKSEIGLEFLKSKLGGGKKRKSRKRKASRKSRRRKSRRR